MLWGLSDKNFCKFEFNLKQVTKTKIMDLYLIIVL
jgi:hypothetical protein